MSGLGQSGAPAGAPGLVIDEAAIPHDAAAPDAVDFVAAIGIGNELDALAYGTPDVYYEPAEELPDYRDPFRPVRLFVARVDGRVVGRASLRTQADDASTAIVSVGVLPDHRGRGIGRALADRVEGLARAGGASSAIAYVGIADGPGPRLPAADGSGSVPAESPGARFLVRRGFALEQLERVSRIALPVPDLAERLVAAERASGPDYVVHTWVGATPERWQRDLAMLLTRMSTDAPHAGLAKPEDVWTVERLVADEERREASDPRRLFVAAVEHVPTGTVVGHTELSVPREVERAVVQYNTLVLREHRGHRLGMLLKVANLDHLERVSPGHPSVFTWNAESNRPMLAVNEAVGFVPVAVDTAWQKSLEPDPDVSG